MTTDPSTLPPLPLPEGIEETYISTADLTYHVLSCGSPSRPLLLLLHGFPELAYSWRKIMLPLSHLGYHVVAYDQRGYGRTTGWDTSPYSSVDLRQFSQTRVVTDALRLVSALGHTSVHGVLGHDFGAVAASMCALMCPDFFRSVILMSHPFKGTATFPLHPVTPSPKPTATTTTATSTIHSDLAALTPPRKAYKWYYASARAAHDLDTPKSTLPTFLRGYFHLKSADWPGNKPHKLHSWTADEIADMPNYYVMPLHSTMREAVALDMADEDPDVVAQTSSRWLPDAELAVYAAEFARTGFQGALNWYRRVTDEEGMRDMEVFAGRKIAVPCLYIVGEKDWGRWQEPGAVEAMDEGRSVMKECYRGTKIVSGAGHWVQQERAAEVVGIVEGFLHGLDISGA